MQYMGLDYHKQHTFATIINKETGEMRQARLSNTPESIQGFISEPRATHAVFEASRNWSLLYELLKDNVSSIKMAHPLRVKAIAAAKVKNDKIDSRVLTELLAADLIPEAHIREEENRTKQSMVRQRAFFVGTRTRIKNRIHVLVDRQPYSVRKTVAGLSDLFGKAGMAWLRTVKEIPKADRILLDQMLMLIDQINDLIAKSDKVINKLFESDPQAQLLATIPGIGKFLAVLISTEIDNIERFPSAEKLSAYTGLVPSTYASANIIRHGRITKQGNKCLRWAFVEAATKAKNSNAQLNSYYNNIFHRKGKHIAKIALARRIVTIAFSMLRDKRSFEPHYMTKNNIKNNLSRL